MTIYAGTGRLAALAASPPAPIAGYCLIYFKADNVLYIKDSSGLETAIGTASAITQLTGEATAIGPGSAAITLDNAAVIGKLLTGFVAGPNSTVLATDTILQAVQKLQSQVSSVASTTLAGDVTGPFGTTVVAFVGTKSALQVATSVDDTLAATAANTASTIVKRDASGNFSANIITANVTGNVSGSAASFTGSLVGDVTGTQGATVVATVGGKTAAAVAQSVTDTIAATNLNTASTIVKRDASGNFVASTITANLTGVASGNELPITATTAADYYRGDKTFQPLNKAAVGLGNVDNTSDVNKPVSTAQQTQLDTKSKLISKQVVVQKTPGPGQYGTIAAAVAYVATQSSSITNPYVIRVGPGVYTEPVLDLTACPYTAIVGDSIYGTVIEPSANNHHIMLLGVYNDISFLTLQNAGAGYAGMYLQNSGIYGLAHKVMMTDCDIGVYVSASTIDTSFYGEYLDFEGSFSYGIKVESSGGAKAYCAVVDHYLAPTNAAVGVRITGPDSSFVATVYEHYGVSSGTGIWVDDGAGVEMASTTIEGVATAIYNPNTGAAATIQLVGCRLLTNTSDIEILNPSTTGTFQGISAHAKVTNSAPGFSWIFLDVDDGELEIRNSLAVTYDDGTHTDLQTAIRNSTSTGIISGGALTDGGGLNANISLGYGYLDDTSRLMRIDWAAQSIALTASAENYLYFSADGLLHKSTTLENLISNIHLGRVVTTASGIEFIDLTYMTGNHYDAGSETLFRDGFGPIYSSGSAVSENATPLHLDVTSGKFFLGVRKFSPAGGTNITFVEYKHSGSSAWVRTSLTAVNNTHYNNGNTYTALPAGQYAKHALYVNGDNSEEQYFLVLGQEYFSTLLLAEGGDLPIAPSYFGDSVSLIASVIVQEGTTSISEILDSRPTIGFKASGTSASSDHQALSNRADATAHSQYLLKAQTDAMGINLDMGGFSITNVNLIDGVDVSAHVTRHLPNGADPLTTAAPLVSLDANTTNSTGTANSLARSDHSHDILAGIVSTQTPDQANAEGSSANLARADHVHNIPSGLPVQIGTSNSSGSAASFALSDHIHSHGAQTSGTLHAVVTTLVNGFMSFVDKVKLDLFSGTTPADTQVLIADGTLTYKPKTVSGDVTLANTGVSTIQTNVVSNSKLAQMPTLTIKGNNTGITADPLDLTTTQTTAILDVFVGDSGSGGTKGLVPAPLAGDTVANKFLKADGTFAQISSSGSLAYFLTNSAADIATYLYLDGFPGGATQYVTDSAPAHTNILQSWVTLSGNPNTTFIPAGTVNVHFHGYKSGGTKTVALYAEIYKRAAGGAETLIVTTGNTIPLTTIEADLPVINASFPDTILLSTDRIVVKVRESITGGGSAPSSITIGFAGSTAARIEVPAAAVTAITSLTGDVSATGPGASAATVNAVGGKTSAAIATSVNDTIAATNVNTVSTIVKRDVNGDIAIRDLTARNITQSGAYYSSVVALTDAATIATDASLGNIFTVTLGGNRTLGAPTNPVDGQKITYRIRQDATGSRTLAFNAVFNFPASLAGLSLSTSINAFDYIGAQYNSVTSKWDVLAFTSGL